jgi:acyl-CoA synthetase (AMP-forming)/AMP-acid ligase II
MFAHLQRFFKQTALVLDGGEEIRYGTLLKEADSLALSCSARTLIFNLCSNTVESICGYLGFLKGGMVQLLLNEKSDATTLKALISIYRPTFIYLPRHRSDIVVEGDEIYSVGRNVLLKLNNSPPDGVHDDLALLLPTSGSTGNAKMVRLSYQNLISNAASIAQFLSIDQQDRPITTMPMNYSYGLSVVNSHLFTGASLALSRFSIAEAGFWHTFKSAQATTFGGVPYTYEMLSKLRLRIDHPHLRYFTQAGGRLSLKLQDELVAFARSHGKKFIVMYGQTEATARMSYLPWEAAQLKRGSIGIAIPGGTFYLENENGIIIEGPELTGELIFQGPNVFQGYANNSSDLSKGDENRGTLKTGDLAKRDKDGFYYIVGRKSRFLKVYGNRVNLSDMEDLAREAGFDAACGGRDDLIEVFITDPLGLGIIPSYLSKRTGLHPLAFKTTVIKEIPRNEVGKVSYSQLNNLCEKNC